MTNYARIRNSKAVDVSTDPDSQFHPDIASEFEQVPDEVRRGWKLVDGSWAEPDPIPEPEPKPQPLKVNPVRFKMLFTSSERVAIKQSTDEAVQDFMDLINDPRLDEVDLNAAHVQEAVQMIEAKGLIASGRADEILAGE